MANQGAVHINVLFATHEMHWAFGPEHSDTRSGIDAVISMRGWFQYGPLSTQRLQFNYGAVKANGIAPSDGYSISVTSPWFSNTLTDLFFYGVSVRVVWTNLLLTVASNCDWSIAADNVKIWISIDGAAETLWIDYDNPGDSGTGFDLRTDILHGGDVACSINPAFPTGGGVPTCTLTLASAESFDSQTRGIVEFGYNYNGGTVDAIRIVSPGQNPLACDCIHDIPTWTYVDSDTVFVIGKLYYIQTITPKDVIHCPCPGGGETVIQPWLIRFTGEQTTGYVNITPETSEIYPFEITQFARCGPPPDGTSQSTIVTTGTEPGPYTYCETRQELVDWFQHDKYCGEALPSVCIIDPGDPIPDCWPYTDTDCYYGAWSQYLWTEAPPCAPPMAANIHLMKVQEQGFNYAVLSSDVLRVERYNLERGIYANLLAYTPAGTLGLAQIAWKRSGTICVLFEEDGVVYKIENKGTAAEAQWSTPMTVATGINPAFAIHEISGIEFAAVYDTDRWKLYMLTPNAVAYTLVGDIVVTPTDDQTAGLEFSPTYENALVFEYNDVGTIYRIMSKNFGNDWSTP